jgi:hypothetical protein
VAEQFRHYGQREQEREVAVVPHGQYLLVDLRMSEILGDKKLENKALERDSYLQP